MTIPKPESVLKVNEDSLDVRLREPVRLSDFAWYVTSLVRENDSFVRSERDRMATQDTADSIMWSRRIRTDVDYVQAEADYEAETAKMTVRFKSSDCSKSRPVYDIYSIRGPRLASVDKFVVQREEATAQQMEELYATLERACDIK